MRFPGRFAGGVWPARLLTIAAILGLIVVLPWHWLGVFALWVVLSIPFGVLVGHCILSED